MIALLNKANYVTVRDRFRAEKFAMSLGERDSTATITVGPEAPEITIGDALKDEDEPGAGIIWIVNKVDTDYMTNTRTISCNHVISLLRNAILFGEQTTATVANQKGATKVTAKKAMVYVLSFQKDFLLDNFAKGYESVSQAYTFNGDTVFDAMETISKTLEDCWWEYDLRSYPFKIHIRDRRSNPVETELRLTRNITSAKLTVDKSTMYTRIFPIGKNDLQLSEKYIKDDTAERTFGMICKTQTENSKETEDALREWAKNELKYHHEPAVTVTVSAIELSQATGEPLDHIMLGGVCQMPLPGYGTTIKERINKMSWSDKIADPNGITVTMANSRETASQIVASSIKSGSKSSRQASSNVSKGVLDIDLRVDTKDKNKYTLWKEDYKGVWKDVGTFSRAVTSWSVSATGGTIKVTAKPQDQSTSVYVKAGEGKKSGTKISGPIQYSTDNKKWNDTGATYSVTVDEEEIRRGVTLKDPSWLKEPGQYPSGNTNTVTVKTQGRNPNLEKSVKLYVTLGGWGTPEAGKRYAFITHTNTEKENRVARIEINATLNDPTWQTEPGRDVTGNSNKVTVSSVTGQSKSKTIYLHRGSWGTPSAGKRYVYITQDDTTPANRVARIDIDAHLSSPSWTKEPSSSITGNSNTVTVNSATGESKSTTIYMSRGDWGAGSLTQGQRYIYVHDGDTTAATRVARISVDATMSGPTWTTEPSSSISGNSNTATISSLTGQSIEVPIIMTRGDWAAGTLPAGERYLYANYSDSTAANRIARILVDARMSDPVWTYGPDASVTGGYNKVTVSSMTGQSKEINLYMNDTIWDSGTKYVYVTQTDSTDANRVMRYTVTIPNPNSMSAITRYQRYAPTGGYSFGNLSKSGLEVGYYYYMTAKVGDKTFTFYFYVQN